MTVEIKDWRNYRGGGTPVDALALKDLEARMAAYADSVAGGASQTQFSTYNAGQVDFTGTTYISATDNPDSVALPFIPNDATGGRLAAVFFQCNAWATNSLYCRLYLDDVPVIDQWGTEVTGDLGAAAAVAAVMTETGAGAGVQMQNVGGGIQAPIAAMGTGIKLWIPPDTGQSSAHWVEVKYRSSTGAPAHISKRRLSVVLSV